MNKKHLIAQLKKLSLSVHPDASWVAAQRVTLRAQLHASTHGTSSLTVKDRLHAWLQPLSTLARPLGALVFTAIVGFGAWIASVDATRNSLPGDILYPVKLTAERVQVNLASNKEDRTALEIVFAERRLKEISEVSKQGGIDEKKKQALKVPLQKYKENITSVKANLEQIKIENPQKAVALAELVDKKTEEYVSKLKEQQHSNTGDQKEVKEAIEKSKVVNDAAVTVIISDAAASAEDPVQQPARVLNKLTEKLDKTQERVTLVRARLEELKKEGIAAIPVLTAEDTSTPTEATKDVVKDPTVAVTALLAKLDAIGPELERARLYLTQQRSDDAYSIIGESHRKMDEIEELLDALDQAQTSAPAEATTENPAPAEATTDKPASEETPTTPVTEVKS